MRMISIFKWIAITSLIAALMFTSAVFTVLVYGKISGNLPLQSAGVQYDGVSGLHDAVDVDNGVGGDALIDEVMQDEAAEQHLPDHHLFQAPLILQYPELPRGCEITTLAMLLQYKGVDVGKMDLLPHMPRDSTPIEWNADGTIAYWGNPHTGFVGDITLHSIGFGIYHTALYGLLKQYVPSAIDMTGMDFEDILMSVARDIPVMVWVAASYQEPDTWVEWDSPDGLVHTTFLEHTVLIVGYDEHYIYVNDPLHQTAGRKADRASFVASWKSLGEQALSYTVDEFK